jgi:RIO kinase 1
LDNLFDPHVHIDPFGPFVPVVEPHEGQRWSTWSTIVKGARGPRPRPTWLVTEDAAIDSELGVLKTGKEADVHLVERAVPGQPGCLLAAKRYRDREHRDFHRDAGYLDGRTVRRSRDQRAIENRTRYGKQVLAGQWAAAEFSALCDLHSRGVPVPYPVSVDGIEVLMEFIGTERSAAPRLAQTRPSAGELADYFTQVTDAMEQLAYGGQAHGDLSPYNLLVHDGRVVMIDLPQVVDIVANPVGMDYLMRDCVNVCRWFSQRGLRRDPEDLVSVLAAAAFGRW